MMMALAFSLRIPRLGVCFVVIDLGVNVVEWMKFGGKWTNDRETVIEGSDLARCSWRPHRPLLETGRMSMVIGIDGLDPE